MSWKVVFSKSSEKFLSNNSSLKEKVLEMISDSIKLLKGKKIALDVKKLKGQWFGFFRIRKGNLRIILKYNFGDRQIFIERIDDRSKSYRK